MGALTCSWMSRAGSCLHDSSPSCADSRNSAKADQLKRCRASPSVSAGRVPWRHHMAAAKAGDAVYACPNSARGQKGGASWSIPPFSWPTMCWAGLTSWSGRKPEAKRDILSGQGRRKEFGAQVMQLLKENHEVSTIIGGRYIHPVGALVGGVREAPHRRRARPSHPVEETGSKTACSRTWCC